MLLPLQMISLLLLLIWLGVAASRMRMATAWSHHPISFSRRLMGVQQHTPFIIPSINRHKIIDNNHYSFLSFASSADDYWDEDDEEETTNHLIIAGNYFKGIDEDVGTAMCKAGVAWSSDWSRVAEALDEAATAFWDVLSKKNISPKLQNICRSVAQELEDISTIEGCSSVGPASSIPNWIAIHGYLDAAAAAYEGDVDDQHIYDILKKTSLEVEALIESI